ncbi:MAG: hypothetical protein OEY86_00890 [Nitrospira sp.]|nr:hypothetical protein [Nitrospira sp.]
MPTAAQAAYTDATIASNRTNDSGAREVQVQFRGNAGESVVTRTYTVVSRGTAADAYAELRIWAGGVMNELDIQHTAGTAAAVQAGQKITPLSKPTVTAAGCSLWQVRYRLLRQFDGHGLTNSTVLSELTTLRNWVNANYTAGCIAEME